MSGALRSDSDNVILAESVEVVDRANQDFYARFPFPWPPMSFPQLQDPLLETTLLNQAIGDFAQRTIPAEAKIWVAGCGTNQAVYTALRFPRATVLGSDLSPTSLETAARNAKTLGLRNLTLRQESLNHVAYSQEFDYIINTGVITVMPVPATPLRNIARALRPNGTLELMVYNRYHRIFTTAFQKAVRTLTRYNGKTATCDEEFAVAKAIAATEPIRSSERMALYKDAPDAQFADSLIQPVEYSYTVESLDALVRECGLELLLPCQNQFDLAAGVSWSIEFAGDLQPRIQALPDVVRWQISNLLLLEKSPMLWFYVCHSRASDDGHFEAAVNEDFLDRKFVRTSTQLRNYVRGPRDLNYRPSPALVPYPGRPSDPWVRQVVEQADGRQTMRQILKAAGVEAGNHKAVTELRMKTTIPLCPYLRAA